LSTTDQSPAGIFSSVVKTALLVGVKTPDITQAEAAEHLDELARLVDTMGLQVVDSILVNLQKPSPRFLVGSGKAEEVSETADDREVDCIIFDNDLSPSQQRNWEELSDLCVIDRQEVILDIFANRASSREAVLQVGLARMEYSLPRLTRAWTHLSRQRGGARGARGGNRGEGETQLEADRRIVVHKINRFKAELKKVRAQRATRRKKRRSIPVPTGAIVGYTNAGKSSLLNALTEAEVFVENKLFATLDPTTRRMPIENGAEVLLTDTVGFIRKLPHDLVDAFKSTLEETVLSDFLIHMLDASSPEVADHFATTTSVLDEMGAGDKPTMTVFNKIDLVKDGSILHNLKTNYPNAIFTSVKTDTGLDIVAQGIKRQVYETTPIVEFQIPANRTDLAALIHRTGRVIRETYDSDTITLAAQVPDQTRGMLSAYIASP
jgi:GTPase